MNIVIVDDQILFAESLKTLIERYTKDIKVIGIAGNGVEAIEIVERTNPEIVLMDIHMPEMNGIEATQRIMSRNPETKVIILTVFGDNKHVREALKSGALGYIMKDASTGELISLFRSTYEGALSISKSAVKHVIEMLDDVEGNRKYKGIDTSKLTKREIEIVKLILTKMNNTQIADQLFLSESTVRNYISSVYSKLNVTNRFELMQLFPQE